MQQPLCQNLPEELWDMIVIFLQDRRSEYAMCLVSRRFRSRLYPIIWKDVPHVHRLLDLLIPGRNFKLIQTPGLLRSFVMEPGRDVREAQMVSLVDMDRAHRLLSIGMHVRVLCIQFCVLPLSLHLRLERLQAEQAEVNGQRNPLLPHLEELHVYNSESYGDWPDLETAPSDACHWFMLFLSPSVLIASLVLANVAPDPHLLVSRAPNLHTLQINLDWTPTLDPVELPGRPAGARLLPDLGLWTASICNVMVQWAVTRFAADGYFFWHLDVVAGIATVPGLRFLTITDPVEEPWATAPQQNLSLFRSLQELDLDSVTPQSAEAILAHVGISRRIRTLRWSVPHRSFSSNGLAAAFQSFLLSADGSSSLKNLCLSVRNPSGGHPPCWGWTFEPALSAIRMLNLESLATEYPERTHVLVDRCLPVGLGSGLRSLELRYLIVPWQMLGMISDEYPQLNWLRLTLDPTNFDATWVVKLYPTWSPNQQREAKAQPLTLVLNISVTICRPDKIAGKQTPAGCARKLRRVWSNVRLVHDKDTETPRDDVYMANLLHLFSL
ncbi:eukaryotic translation initiation factor 3 subunit B [Ceratobasidium sp. AG-Ba]|nr:eukaryotic translation initiation factor 3 subunit B [Ceratobasidium sp. AG-Ba]